jgi:4-hydroxy-tetrahydrodipicolinate reductase
MDSSQPLRIAIAGALGRMGRAVATAVRVQENAVLAALFDRPEADDEALALRDTALDHADVVIDFTTPDASAALARLCGERGGPALVIGSTGFTAEQEQVLAQAATRIPILRSGNFSLGVNMLLGLVRQAAKALPAEAYDIEVVETHHRRKLDAPSGTALMLGEAAARGRGVRLADVAVRGRDGITGERPIGDIGFAAIRGGGVVGEHSVLFAAEDEVLTLSHGAIDRGLFARGAVTAAAWLVGKPAGLYDMQDVLGFPRD